MAADDTNARSALELLGISHRFGTTPVLRDVSITVAPGEILALLGPSGCGKTTLLRVAAGLEELQTGQVVLAGRTMARAGWAIAPENRNVGLVFQDYALFPHLNVDRNVAFGVAGLTGAALTERVKSALNLVGMSDFAEAYPHALSGGQQQRVALARALAPEPAVLLLDEPFSGLDSRLRESVRRETLAILKKLDAAAIVVTHDPEEAMEVADRIAVMNHGRIEQLGTPMDVYGRPQNYFVGSFMGDMNELTGVVRGGCVHSQIGQFAAHDLDAGGLEDGSAVRLLVRPEAIQFCPADAGDGTAWEVASCRFLGRFTALEVQSSGCRVPPAQVRVHSPGMHRLAVGSHVTLSVAHNGIHCFADDIEVT